MSPLQWSLIIKMIEKFNLCSKKSTFFVYTAHKILTGFTNLNDRFKSFPVFAFYFLKTTISLIVFLNTYYITPLHDVIYKYYLI